MCSFLNWSALFSPKKCLNLRAAWWIEDSLLKRLSVLLWSAPSAAVIMNCQTNTCPLLFPPLNLLYPVPHPFLSTLHPVSSQCWGKARWWPTTTAGSRGEEATCGSSPPPPSPSTTKPRTNATSSGSTTSWGQCNHCRATLFYFLFNWRTADMSWVYICGHHTVYKDPLKG